MSRPQTHKRTVRPWEIVLASLTSDSIMLFFQLKTVAYLSEDNSVSFSVKCYCFRRFWTMTPFLMFSINSNPIIISNVTKLCCAQNEADTHSVHLWRNILLYILNNLLFQLYRINLINELSKTHGRTHTHNAGCGTSLNVFACIAKEEKITIHNYLNTEFIKS